MREISGYLQEFASRGINKKSSSEIDAKSYSRLIALDILKDCLLRFKSDQTWLYKIVITKSFEYFVENKIDMLVKAQWINILKEIIDVNNIESFFIKTDYLALHTHLVSILALALDLNHVDPKFVIGLTSQTVFKWDVGLWKFIPAATNSSEYNTLMNPTSYAKTFTNIIGPNNMLNTEWLLITLKNSFKLVGYIFDVINRTNKISVLPLKPIIEGLLKSFKLFQELTELPNPIGPWNVSVEKWDETTHVNIVECKAEILKIIIYHLKSDGTISQLMREMVLC